jgi:uncharacterized protein involved in outer membrane biogenesis
MRRLLIVFAAVVAVLAIALVAGFVALQRIDWNQYKQPISEMAREATGRRLDLGGDIGLEIGLRPGIELSGVSFENAAWGSRPEMATVERVLVRLRLLPLLSGQVVVNRVEVVGLDVLLETSVDGIVNWDFGAAEEATGSAGTRGESAGRATAPAGDGGGASSGSAPEELAAEEEQAVSTVLRNVLIEDAVVVIRDQASGEEQRVAVDRLRARSEGGSAPLALELDLELGVEPIRITGEIGGLPQVQAGGPLALDLAVEAGGAQVTIAGEIGKPLTGEGLDLEVTFAAERLGRLGAVAAAELPDLGPVDLKASVTGGGDTYEIRDLALGIGSSRITGRIDAGLSGKRPRIEADFVASRIDLADFEEPAVNAQAMGDPPPEKLFSGEPLSLGSFGLADARIGLEADALVSGGLELSALSVAVRLEDRVLDVDPLRAGLAGGRLDLALQVNASGKRPRVAIAGKTRAVDVGRLARSQGSEILSGGPLDLDFDLVGWGASVREIMASLGGTLSLRMGAATLEDEMAGLALSDLKSVLRGEGGAKTARIECVWADFAVEKGIARPDGIVVDLSSIVLFGAGKIDLGRELLDLEFDRQAHSRSASEALPPFSVEGPLSEPSVGIAAAALAGRVLDLGAQLLDDEREVVDEREKPATCQELLAQYQQDQADRGSTSDVTRKAAGDLGDKAGKTGKKVLDKLKGLFGR